MNNRKHNLRIILWSVIWAIGLIACGVWFKGNPAKNQVLAAVTVSGVFVLLALLPRRANCVR